jgi:hypothetical protein
MTQTHQMCSNISQVSRITLLFLLSFLNLFCNSKNTRQNANRAFYYWKNEGLPRHPLEDSLLKPLKINRLYIRIFDVDWQPILGAVPSSLHSVTFLNDTTSIWFTDKFVPVVFIKNDVFNKISEEELEAFAVKMSKAFNRFPRIEEAQVDCDWTQGTRDKYFTFLNLLKAQTSKKISTTIRLHQIKDRSKMGIPPVDRGMLMLYNLTNPSTNGAENSIFDLKQAQNYLKGQPKYPLPMDVVMPLFSWGIWYQYDKYKGLIRAMNRQDANALSFLKKTTDRHYEVKADTVYEGSYLRIGDKIEIEDVTADDLTQCAQLAQSMLNSDHYNIVFFHFDSKILKQYPNGTLEKIYQSFH